MVGVEGFEPPLCRVPNAVADQTSRHPGYYDVIKLARMAGFEPAVTGVTGRGLEPD